MYHQINLADHTLVGQPGPLPYAIANWSPTQVADVTAAGLDPSFGLAGQGFWPVVMTTPGFDSTTQILAGTATYTIDVTGRQVNGVEDVRALTSAELAANLTAAQQAKVASIGTSCGAQIVSGYTSSALGSPYTYPSQVTDQLNMVASVAKSGLPGTTSGTTFGFKCADASGAWAMRQHSIAQIQMAGSDGFAAIAAAQDKLAALQLDVAAATTVAAVNAINW